MSKQSRWLVMLGMSSDTKRYRASTLDVLLTIPFPPQPRQKGQLVYMVIILDPYEHLNDFSCHYLGSIALELWGR